MSSRSRPSSGDRWIDGASWAGEALRRRRPAHGRLSAERRLQVARADAGWVETVETIPWTIVRLRVTGAIESSLYDALDRAVADTFLPGAERRALAWAIADVYDWEVDFTRDVRAGDRFIVLLDRLESPEGERRFGRILAARVDVARTPSYAFYFEDGATGGAGFYDDQGRSLRRAFLRAPLAFRRISSRFGSRSAPECIQCFRGRGRPTTRQRREWGSPTQPPPPPRAAYVSVRFHLVPQLDPQGSPPPAPTVPARDD